MNVENEQRAVLDGGRKQSIRERFRERVSKKTEKTKTNDAEALDDFLRSPSAGDVLPAFPSPYRKPVPRINISPSSRWPDAQDVLRSDKDVSYTTKEGEDTVRLQSKRKKSKNLHVRFTELAPEVMGEGGDEAEDPTIQISERKHTSTAEQRHKDDKDIGATDSFRPRLLGRAPTGLGNRSLLKEDDNAESDRADDASVYSESNSESNSSDPNSSSVQRKMREDEGRAFTAGLREPSPEIPARKDEKEAVSGSEMALEYLSIISGRDDPSSSVSDRSTSVASPPSSDTKASSEHAIAPKPSPEPFSSPTNNIPYQTYSPAVVSPQPQILPKQPPTSSDVDTLNEFKLHGRRYYSIFALAAEKTHQQSAVSLTSWVRTATWWFLTAETAFKFLKRDLQGGVAMAQILSSRRLSQAMVDLAKMSWIVEDVVPSHAKEEAVDVLSPPALEAFLRNNPNSRASHTLRHWQDLCKRLQNLASAAHRSGFIPSSSEEMPLSAGIDSTIWVTYPGANHEVSRWLRVASPSWVQIDESIAPPEPLDVAQIIPLKSTNKFFRIKSFFGRVCLYRAQRIKAGDMPCAVTLARRNGSHALVFCIASQDNSVNVVIETDPIRGDGMQHQHNAHSISFSFADGFCLSLNFEQIDYSQLMDTYALAFRALTAAVAGRRSGTTADERVIFQAKSEAFERRAKQKVGGFPGEGIQRDCEIILLERHDMRKDVPTAQSSRRTLYLRVVLSPSNPNLGVLEVQLGGEKPILIDMAGNCSPPRIEILELHQASLQIQFSELSDLEHFYEILSGTNHTSSEQKKEPGSLRSFSLRHTLASSPEVSAFLAQAKWERAKVRLGVAERSHDQANASCSGVNVCVSSKEMAIAGRLAQEPCSIRFVLSVADPTSLIVQHPPDSNARLVLQYKAAPPNGPALGQKLLSQLQQAPALSEYCFASQADLHTFQNHLTDSKVLFDGATTSISVSRSTGLRAKKEDLGVARVQLLHTPIRQDRHILLAFCDKGSIMNFTVHATNVIEKAHSGRGRFGVRLLGVRVQMPSITNGGNDSPMNKLAGEDEEEGKNVSKLISLDDICRGGDRSYDKIRPFETSRRFDEAQHDNDNDENDEKNDVVLIFDSEARQEELIKALSTLTPTTSTAAGQGVGVGAGAGAGRGGIKKAGSVFRGAFHLR